MLQGVQRLEQDFIEWASLIFIMEWLKISTFMVKLGTIFVILESEKIIKHFWLNENLIKLYT